MKRSRSQAGGTTIVAAQAMAATQPASSADAWILNVRANESEIAKQSPELRKFRSLHNADFYDMQGPA